MTKMKSSLFFVCLILVSSGILVYAYDPSTDVRFIFGSDSQTLGSDTLAITRAMTTFNPDFILHGGDHVTDGRVQSQWDEYAVEVVGELGDIPLFPAIGNHEYNAQEYYDFFGVEEWYSFDWTSDVHVVVLNSDSSSLGEETSWLESDLASTSARWKIVVFHRSLFDGRHYAWSYGVDNWMPIFEEYDVDLVLMGHNHVYMRTQPQNDVTYVVGSGWGSAIYAMTDGDWVACQEAVHHFVLVDVFVNGTLSLQAKDEYGSTFDVWRSTKPVASGEYSALVTSSTPTTITVQDDDGAGNQFSEWLKDGVFFSSSRTITIADDAHYQAVYTSAPPPPPPPSSVLFEDDFEGDLLDWAGDAISSGGVSVSRDTSEPYQGVAHAKFVCGPASWGRASLYTDLAHVTEVEIEAMVWIDRPLHNGEGFLLIDVRGDTGDYIARVGLKNAVNNWYIAAKTSNDVRIDDQTPVTSADARVYYLVTLRIGFHATDGFVELYVNGNKLRELTDINTLNNGVLDRVYFGVAGAKIAQHLTVYGDAFKVSELT